MSSPNKVLQRARDLVESNMVELPADFYRPCQDRFAEGWYAVVQSQTYPGTHYRVTPSRCTCRAFHRHKECKHVEAVNLALLVLKERDEADRARILRETEDLDGCKKFCPDCRAQVSSYIHGKSQVRLYACECGWTGENPLFSEQDDHALDWENYSQWGRNGKPVPQSPVLPVWEGGGGSYIRRRWWEGISR